MSLPKHESFPELTRIEVAEMLDSFVAGREKPFDHEKIYYGAFTDPLLLELKERFPDLWEGPHFGVISQEESNRIFLDYARQLRSDGEQSPKEST